MKIQYATNAAGSIVSPSADRGIALPGRVVNLSILTSLQVDEDGFTLGVVLGGRALLGSSRSWCAPRDLPWACSG